MVRHAVHFPNDSDNPELARMVGRSTGRNLVTPRIARILLALALLVLVGCRDLGPTEAQSSACLRMCTDLGLQGKAYRELFRGIISCECRIPPRPLPTPAGGR